MLRQRSLAPLLSVVALVAIALFAPATGFATPATAPSATGAAAGPPAKPASGSTTVPAKPIAFPATAPAASSAVERLQTRIAALLNSPDLAHGFWGIEVASLATGEALYSQNSGMLFTPASNTKLFTTAAALALIGPDYKFRTTVETTGTLDRYGRLNGDLVLVGHGDPNLSGRELPYDGKTQRNDDALLALEALADALVKKGVKFVDGDIVADDSYFAFERYGEGWSQDDLVWADGAPVSALTVNDNVVFVKILPADRPGEKAFVSLNPFADYYRIDNRIVTTPAGTGRRFCESRARLDGRHSLGKSAAR